MLLPGISCLRSDRDTAYRDFRWPELDEFNGVLDYFDELGHAEHVDRTALWLEFVDLPKTISGKIRRVALRTAETARKTHQRLRGEYFDMDFRKKEQ